jgi:hypothetical protein
LTLRVNQSLAKMTAIVNCRSARPPRLIQIVAPFSSRLSRNTVYPAGLRSWIARHGGLTTKMIYLQGRDLSAIVPPCGTSVNASVHVVRRTRLAPRR